MLGAIMESCRLFAHKLPYFSPQWICFSKLKAVLQTQQQGSSVEMQIDTHAKQNLWLIIQTSYMVCVPERRKKCKNTACVEDL